MSANTHFISLKAWLAFLLYLIIPVFSLLLIIQSYPELPQDRLYMRLYWVIPTATVIVIFAQLSALYRKGEAKRFLLNIGFTVATLVWMVGLLGGSLVMTTQWNGYDFSIHMDKYVLLISCVALLNIIYYTLEWRVYRKENHLYPLDKKKTTCTAVK